MRRILLNVSIMVMIMFVQLAMSQQSHGEPMDIIFLIDESGSTAGENKFLQEVGFVEQVTQSLVIAPSDVNVGLVLFDDDARVALDLSGDAGLVSTELQNITPQFGSSSCLSCGIQDATDILVNTVRANAIPIIIMLNDGPADSGENNVISIISNGFNSFGILTFPVSVGSGVPVGFHEAVSSAGGTGGVVFDAADAQAFITAFEEFFGPTQTLFCGQPQEAFSAVIQGTPGRDYLIGTPGNDLILGDSGNDVIFGNEGNDCILAGVGNDFVAGRRGDDEIHGGSGDDVLLGNKGLDVIHGDRGEDFINGNRGDDMIFGGGDDDILLGGQGNDNIEGGIGQDTCDAVSGADILDCEVAN